MNYLGAVLLSTSLMLASNMAGSTAPTAPVTPKPAQNELMAEAGTPRRRSAVNVYSLGSSQSA